MPEYTYGGYVYFKNMTDTPNKNHHNFILNQIPDFHITSPFKLMDDIVESITKLFVDKMKKMNEITCPIVLISYQKSMYGTKRTRNWN